MKLFIAEKPELGRAIATALHGIESKAKGYIQKGDNIITWAFGHILELAEPHIYNEKYQKWVFEDLPIQIDEFQYLPKKDSKEQLKVICSLINKKEIQSIVHCGDADDEGQILIDEILTYANNKKPVFRVLINDITPKAIQHQISGMRPNSDFKGMSERGFARSQADWIVGINLTRAYTTIARQKGYQDKTAISVGRVQTPILGLIVARDKEYEGFTTKDYFSLHAYFHKDSKTFKAKHKTQEKIFDETIAQEILHACSNKSFICKVMQENKKEYPPLPYNLLILQAECAKAFGYKPDKVLTITQSLREKHKLITYNRSDCQYLPETKFEEAKEIIEAVKEIFSDADSQIQSLCKNTNLNIKSKAFNDKNLSAHYGIIPTTSSVPINNLSTEERNIYEMIAKRFLVQFYEPREYLHTEVLFQYKEHEFVISSNTTTKSGYISFFGVSQEYQQEQQEFTSQENNENDLSCFHGISQILCKDITIEKNQTKPRPYYTMPTLLKDLTSVAKYISNERIKKLLLERDKDKKVTQ
ncbi:DNA topoisomerase III [Helicobacter didelphidarum]|uniref:DNA topoisomerase n=1 Tax=Helicobacter didelphidarum TaxID=2040648 RepID=A0A3D8IAN7_9HELI|nr:DNA topoisomerase III [Helicobacter didelphidarum]